MKHYIVLLIFFLLPVRVSHAATVSDLRGEDGTSVSPEYATCHLCRGLQEKTNGAFYAPKVHASFCGNDKLAGTLLVKGLWGGLWAANALILYRLYNELSMPTHVRTDLPTRGISDLVYADLTKLATPKAIKVISGAIAGAAVAYALYEEIAEFLAAQKPLEEE